MRGKKSRVRWVMGVVLLLLPSSLALGDGVPYFAQNDTIPDVMILIDASSSMAAPIQGSNGKPRIVHAAELIKQLVQENKDIRWGLAHTSPNTPAAALSCRTGGVDVQIGVNATGAPTNNAFTTALTNLECSVMGKDFFDCSKSPTPLNPGAGKGCKYHVTCPSSAPSGPTAGIKDYEGAIVPDTSSLTTMGEWKRSITNDTGAKACRKRAMIFVTGGAASVVARCVNNTHNDIATLYSYPSTKFGLNGKTIPTYVLGFNLTGDVSYTELDMIAEAGQGLPSTGTPGNGVDPYSALNTTQFNAAFAEIYNQIIAGSYTNSSPVVSRDYQDLYQAYFTILNNPSLTEKYYAWQGHLQDYVLDPATGAVDTDQSDSFAGKTDVKTWLDSSSYASRKIYTSYDNGSNPYTRVQFNASNSAYFWRQLDLASNACDDDVDGYADGDNVDCDTAVNTINTTMCPDSVTTSSIGVTGTQADANALINFILGDTTKAYDGCAASPSTATRRESWRLLDIYNSTPRLLGPPSSYSSDPDYDLWQSTPPQKDRPDILVVGSNGGMIHAFRAAVNTNSIRVRSNGQELWGYVPQHILPKLKDIWRIDPHPTMIDATAGVEDVKLKTYGDSVEKWRTVAVIGDGINGDETSCALDAITGKPNYYCGYYTAVDVSNYEGGNFVVKPLWEFYGDADILTAAATPEFGIVRDQTIGSAGNYRRSVAFLPGIGTDGTGGASGWGLTPSVQASPVYVVDMADADSETRLAKIELDWHNLSDPAQPHGIIARPLAVDTDNDLLVDRLFVGDQDAYLWRVDLSSDKPSDWGSSPTPSEAIFSPGVTYAMTTVGSPYSGPRYLPISFPPAATYSSGGDLLVYFGTGDPRTVSYGGPPGYFFAMQDKKAITSGSSAKLLPGFTPIKFAAGEGLAGEPVLVNGVIYFTTYYVDTNTASSTNGCGLGKARVWGVGYLDGSPQMDSDNNGTPDAKFIELGRGIPGNVVVGYDRWYVQVNDSNVGGTSGSLKTGATASGAGTVEPFMPYGWAEVTGRLN